MYSSLHDAIDLVVLAKATTLLLESSFQLVVSMNQSSDERGEWYLIGSRIVDSSAQGIPRLADWQLGLFGSWRRKGGEHCHHIRTEYALVEKPFEL